MNLKDLASMPLPELIDEALKIDDEDNTMFWFIYGMTNAAIEKQFGFAAMRPFMEAGIKEDYGRSVELLIELKAKLEKGE